LFYALLFYFKNNKAPSLTNVFAIIMSFAAIFKGLELVGNIIFNTNLNIGQLNDSKLLIILGGFAVSWIGTISCAGKFKNMKDN
jgi:uncharacterized membrane protein YfcA